MMFDLQGSLKLQSSIAEAVCLLTREMVVVVAAAAARIFEQLLILQCSKLQVMKLPVQ